MLTVAKHTPNEVKWTSLNASKPFCALVVIVVLMVVVAMVMLVVILMLVVMVKAMLGGSFGGDGDGGGKMNIFLFPPSALTAF